LEDQEGDRKIILRWIYGKQVMRVRGIWNWLRIMYTGVGAESLGCTAAVLSYMISVNNVKHKLIKYYDNKIRENQNRECKKWL
jgi:hypothetical protein